MDLLEDWVNAMKEYRQNNNVVNPVFSDDSLENIRKNIEKFFPKRLYTLSAKSYILDDNKNWLKSFLAKKVPSSIGYAIELYNIIKYYYETSNNDIDSSRLNMDQIKDKFFELLINLLLIKNGIKSNSDDAYSFTNRDNGKLINKPLDSSFIYGEKKYLIECKKVYDINLTELSRIMNQTIKNITLKKGEQKRIINYTMPTGYILFNKNLSKSILHDVTKDFEYWFNLYLQNSSSIEGSPIPEIKAQAKEGDYEIYIGSSRCINLKSYKEKIDNFKLAVSFLSYVEADTGYTRILFETQHVSTEQEIIDRLYKKITKAINQHKETHLDKIIFLELEDINFIFGTVTQSIDINNLNYDKINDVIKENISVCLFSKRYQDEKIDYQIKLFNSSSLNAELSRKIENLNLNFN